MTTVSAAVIVWIGCMVIAYAITRVALAISTLAEQLSLGVRVTGDTAPSAHEALHPPADGVVAWPTADGWSPPPPIPDVPDTVPQWKDADTVDTKARTSDNNHPQPSAVIDESPELRGKRGHFPFVD